MEHVTAIKGEKFPMNDVRCFLSCFKVVSMAYRLDLNIASAFGNIIAFAIPFRTKLAL